MDISQGKELSGPEIQVPNTARMAEKCTLFDFQFHSLKKNAHLSESKSEECVSGEQRDKDSHVSDIDGHSDSDASEVDEVWRSEHLTDGEPVEKQSKC